MEKQIEEKQFECPGKIVPTDADCPIFWEAKYFCPYAEEPNLIVRINLPSCPHFVWVKR